MRKIPINWKRPLIIFLASAVFTLATFAIGFFAFANSNDDLVTKLTAAVTSEGSAVFDRRGSKIGQLQERYQIFVPYEKIPKDLVNATIAVEDRDFFKHNGVSFRAIARAGWVAITNGGLSQGGSTLTMQLVKNYILSREKKISRKLREIILAVRIEKLMPKERLLEIYLNTMYLGHGSYGVAAASQRYFGKELNQLNMAEYALIAGLFQSPSGYDPHRSPKRALARQKLVLKAMQNAGYLDEAGYKKWSQWKVKFVDRAKASDRFAAHFLAWIRELVPQLLQNEDVDPDVEALKIYSTLDLGLQRRAWQAVQNAKTQLDSLGTRDGVDWVDAGLLATDPSNGSVLSLVGGRDFVRSQFNRAIRSVRSPGSAFKPIVYSLALDNGMTWASLVSTLDVAWPGYKPRNLHSDFPEQITLAKALYESVNSPVVALAQKYGINRVIERARATGVETSLPSELGVSIGGAGVTMQDMARSYGTFASGGVLIPLHAIERIESADGFLLWKAEPPEEQRALSAQTAALLTSGLQTVLSHGTGTVAADLAPWAAGKTGTSDDSRDNWLCGYARDIVTIVWVGADNNASLGKRASGSQLAAPIWKRYMLSARDILGPPQDFPVPSGVVATTIDPDTGSYAPEGPRLLFESGTQPAEPLSDRIMRDLKDFVDDF
jgi:penicillin-binding protein 1A